MKKIYTLLSVFLLTFSIYAQAPELMSYQAIVRDANDALIQNGNVGVRISILQGSETGSAVYTETHTASTNDNGLVTLEIGSGNTSDDFSTIDWSSGSYFIKSETDPNGGTNYSIQGTSQLLSVPYALYAKSSGDSDNSSSPNPFTNAITTQTKTGKQIVVYTDTMAYGFTQYNGATSNWDSQSLSGIILGAVASENGIVIYTTTNAYGFTQYNEATANWDSQTLSEEPIGAISSKNSIVVYTSTTAYGFTQYNEATANWDSQTLSGLPIGAVNSNNSIVLYTSTTAYGFTQYNGATANWDSQTLSGIPISAVGNDATIVVLTTTNAYGFTQYNGATANWDSQTLSGTPEGIVGH